MKNCSASAQKYSDLLVQVGSFCASTEDVGSQDANVEVAAQRWRLRTPMTYGKYLSLVYEGTDSSNFSPTRKGLLSFPFQLLFTCC